MAESKQSQSIGNATVASVMAQSAPCLFANAAIAHSACSIASVPSAATTAQSPLALAMLANKSHAKAANIFKANVCAASYANTQASAQCASRCSCIAKMPCSLDS